MKTVHGSFPWGCLSAILPTRHLERWQLCVSVLYFAFLLYYTIVLLCIRSDLIFFLWWLWNSLMQIKDLTGRNKHTARAHISRLIRAFQYNSMRYLTWQLMIFTDRASYILMSFTLRPAHISRFNSLFQHAQTHYC